MAIAASLTSCDVYKDGSPEDHVPTALVTVKPVSSDYFIMQLDDDTRLEASNMTRSPYGEKTVRALVNYDIEDRKNSHYQRVHVNWMDSIRTKMPAPTMGDENNSTYGNDPLEVVKDWVTVAEDGFLTLRIRTRWGRGTTHEINLLTGVNPENPYQVELRHDAKGDVMGNMGDAMIAFNLRGLLRNAKTENVKLSLVYRSFSGEKKVDFDLRSKPMDDMGDITKAIEFSRSIK